MAETILTLATAMGAKAGVASSLAAALPSASTAAIVAGTGLGALGIYRQGQQQKAIAKSTAAQLEAQGDEEEAIAGVKAKQRRREKELALSRATAVAAASGAGADGDTVTNIMEGIEEQGEYNALVEMYQGRTRRNNRYAQASSTRAEGAGAGRLGAIGALAKLGRGVSTIYSR